MARGITPLNGGEWEAGEGSGGYVAAELAAFVDSPGIDQLDISLHVTIDGIEYDVPPDVSGAGGDAVLAWLEERAGEDHAEDEEWDLWDAYWEAYCDGYTGYKGRK